MRKFFLLPLFLSPRLTGRWPATCAMHRTQPDCWCVSVWCVRGVMHLRVRVCVRVHVRVRVRCVCWCVCVLLSALVCVCVCVAVCWCVCCCVLVCVLLCICVVGWLLWVVGWLVVIGCCSLLLVDKLVNTSGALSEGRETRRSNIACSKGCSDIPMFGGVYGVRRRAVQVRIFLNSRC